MLPDLADKAAIGPATYGQAGELDDHNYGLSATINRAWVFDDTDPDNPGVASSFTLRKTGKFFDLFPPTGGG